MFRMILLLGLLTSIAQASYIESTQQFETIKLVRRHYAGEIQSTQDTILEHLKDVTPEQWVMVSADAQKGGKGMWGRDWVSPPGNVFVTYALPIEAKMAPYLSQMAGVVMCDTLHALGLNPQLRWVNNALIGDEKIGGVLCKIIFSNRTYTAIVGIGINVSLDKETAQGIDQPVTSLLLKLGAAPSVDDVIAKLSADFYRRFSSNTPIYDEYNQLLAYKGQEITVYTGPNNTGEPTHFTGIFERITPEGHLVLSGHEKPFISGEIVPKSKDKSDY